MRTCSNCQTIADIVYETRNEKEHKKLFGFLEAIFIVILFVGLVCIFVGLNDIELIALLIPGYVCTGTGFSLLLITIFVQMLLPFKVILIAKYVCPNCGKTWYIEQEPQKTDNSNDQKLY